jgi:Domain of unknown function (DUF4276)
MIRLHLVVEGQTEEIFIREVLSLELASYSIIATAHRITTSRSSGVLHRGGFVKYAHLRRDLDLWMKQDRNADARFSTMIDLYRLPSDCPGFDESRGIIDPLSRARFLEAKLAADLDDRRLLPYIQLHEFEALLWPCEAATRLPPPDHFAVHHGRHRTPAERSPVKRRIAAARGRLVHVVGPLEICTENR